MLDTAMNAKCNRKNGISRIIVEKTQAPMIRSNTLEISVDQNILATRAGSFRAIEISRVAVKVNPKSVQIRRYPITD
jgi:hypothetical protein